MSDSSKNVRIFRILCATITEGKETPWQEIVEEVKKKENIKNWLTEVRGVLQFMIDQGVIRRTDSVHVEHYVRVR